MKGKASTRTTPGHFLSPVGASPTPVLAEEAEQVGTRRFSKTEQAETSQGRAEAVIIEISPRFKRKRVAVRVRLVNLATLPRDGVRACMACVGSVRRDPVPVRCYQIQTAPFFCEETPCDHDW